MKLKRFWRKIREREEAERRYFLKLSAEDVWLFAKYSSLLLYILVFVCLGVNITYEAVLALKTNYFNPKPILFSFLHHISHRYLPILLFALQILPKRSSSWRRIFNWKILALPSLSFILFSFIQYRFDPVLDYNTEILGFKWQWSAIAVWISLWLIQLVLYQNRGVDWFHAFCLSFYGVCLASILYEVPWHYNTQRWQCLSSPKFWVSLLATTLLLYSYTWKPPKLLIFGFIPCLLGWTMYHHPLAPGWLLRLTVFPFLCLIPSGIRGVKNARD